MQNKCVMPGLVGTLLVAMLTGCSTVNVQSDYDPTVDFTTYRTWDWLPDPAEAAADFVVSDPFARSRIRNAIETELSEKGYRRSSDSPDFLLRYHAALGDNLTVTQVNDSYRDYPYSDFSWSQTYTYEWQVGTLVLDVFDTRADQLAWRGSVQGEVRQTDNSEKKTERINKAVQKLLAKFPPKR